MPYPDVVAIADEPGSCPGRPRRFAEAEELQRIYDAAFEQIRAKLADVLAVADISTMLALLISAATWETSSQRGVTDPAGRGTLRASLFAFVGRALGCDL